MASVLTIILNYKNRNAVQLYFALLCIACMFFGMLCARALVGIASICFCFNGIFYFNSILQLKKLFKNVFYWGAVSLFLITCVSGIWGSFNTNWQYGLLVKLPMLVLPIGFFALEKITEKQFHIFIIILAFLLFCGTCYSLIAYYNNPEEITANYIFAKVMPTPFDGNHIYFSFTIVCLVVFLIYVFKSESSKTKKYLAFFFIAWFCVYLHILAAKTGILLLYIALAIHGLYLFLKSKQKRPFFLFAFITICLPIAMFYISPTFKNRITYIQYDYYTTIRNINTPGLSDGSRWRSILAGSAIFKDNITKGVGAGQIMNATNIWYDKNTPTILPYERMLPSSQFLWYLDAAGLLGIAGCCFYIFSFFYKQKINSGWLSLTAIIVFFLSYEIGHHGQYGILVIMLMPWLWKTGTANKDN